MVPKQKGYTLIEILVVMLIMSIVTSVAVLSIRYNENKELETFSHEVVALVKMAEEQAMLEPAVLGLSIDHQTVHVSRYVPGTGNEKSSWVPLQDRVFTLHTHPSHLQLQLSHQTKDDPAINQPQIIISMNGELTPFTITVGKQGASPRYLISGVENGSVTSKPLP